MNIKNNEIVTIDEITITVYGRGDTDVRIHTSDGFARTLNSVAKRLNSGKWEVVSSD